MTSQKKIRRFEDAVLPHLDAAYIFARWLIRNEQDTEDIVQEAMLRAYKFLDGFRGDNGRAWLLGIVRNTCYTWLQQNQKQALSTPFDEELHSLEDGYHYQLGDTPESIIARKDNTQLLNQALEKLPLVFREVILLRDLEELSYKEIAGIAAIPIGTVMSRLARGRKLLWEYLSKNEAEVR